ncbi:MAG: methylenetetrahydrofolate reductase [Gemmatimonadetes bacterium]|nr:methylenetetrahydrofolate reductase [Gemmatimonadota bacterium]
MPEGLLCALGAGIRGRSGSGLWNRDAKGSGDGAQGLARVAVRPWPSRLEHVAEVPGLRQWARLDGWHGLRGGGCSLGPDPLDQREGPRRPSRRVGVEAQDRLEQCQALKDAGVDAVNVPDGPRAQSRMGVLPSAIMIEREVGIEPVIHYCCRDRNLLGMLSDLLGASAAGLRNLLMISGDPPKMGPYQEATTVFDIDSIGLTNLAYKLNHGLDPGGNPIGEPTKFVLGVGVNPAAVDLEHEISRFKWKIDAGAEFAVTHPIFDPDQLEKFMKRTEDYRIPIIAGIWPLVSLLNAEFLANEVPGVSIPENVLSRMKSAQGKGDAAAVAEGIAIGREIFREIKNSIQGVQVSAPFGRVDVALEVFGQ